MNALADFRDPESGRSAVELGQIQNIQVAGGRVSLTLALTTMSAPLWKETQAECAALLRQNLPEASRDQRQARRA